MPVGGAERDNCVYLGEDQVCKLENNVERNKITLFILLSKSANLKRPQKKVAGTEGRKG